MTNKKHSRTLRLDSSYSVTTWRVLTGWAWRLDREGNEITRGVYAANQWGREGAEQCAVAAVSR